MDRARWNEMDSIFELGVAAGGGLEVVLSAERADRRNKTEVVVRWAAETNERVWEPGERGRLEAQGSVRKGGGAKGEVWVVDVLRESGGVWRDGDGMEGGEEKAHMPVERSSSSKRGTKSGWPCDLGSKRPTRKLSRLALSFFPSTKSTTNPTR